MAGDGPFEDSQGIDFRDLSPIRPFGSRVCLLFQELKTFFDLTFIQNKLGGRLSLSVLRRLSFGSAGAE